MPFIMNLILRLFLLLVITNKSSSLKHISPSDSKNSINMSEIMLDDIESAFLAVTNITQKTLRNKIIPEMYNLSCKPTFVFKLPDFSNKLGYSVLSIDRSELRTPIFPNLTSNSEKILLKKQSQVTVRHKENSATIKPIEWTTLGLEGWTGDVTNATELLESSHKDLSNEYQRNKTMIGYELTNNFHEKIILSKDVPFANVTALAENNILNNLYIARVNDPFGYSTKWFRNKNINLTRPDDDRQKRDIVELYSMIKCATGCEPLNYKSYGCYCGFLGRGTAVNGIDNCCKAHDKCYEYSNCVSYSEYFVPYVWKCFRGKPFCALNHGEWGGATSCAALLCHCDTRLSLCLRKYTCPQRKAVCSSSLARKIQNIFF